MTRLRLIFMGSPDFSVPALRQLAAAGHELACVYTQPPRPAGRGKKERLTPVHAEANALGLPVRHPVSLKSEEAASAFAALQADLAIVIAYGLILPQSVLSAPRLGCLNMHASLLPRWRGAAPIQRAIMAGDSETGVQAMMMEAGLDTGPVIATARTPISPDDTASTLHDRLAELSAGLAGEAIAALADGSARPQPQSSVGITYAHKITPKDQQIDWQKSAREVDGQIRGLSSHPAAWFYWTPPGSAEPVRIKALQSCLLDDDGPPGFALDDTLKIACGSGAIRILRLQKPGKGPMEADNFLRGTPIPAGSQLG